MSTKGGSRRLVLGLGLSLAAHAVLAAWILHRGTMAARRPSTPQATDLELVSAPKPQAPPSTSLPTAPSPVRRQALAQRAPPSFANASQPEAPTTSPPPAATDVPRLPDLAAAGSAAAAQLDLGVPVVVARRPPSGVQAPEAPADPSALASEIIDANNGHERVERGLVDPYFSALSQVLAKGWHPAISLDRPGLAGYVAMAEQNAKLGMQLFGKVAEAYGESGSPLGQTERDAHQQSYAQAAADYQRRMVEAYRAKRRALVRLTQSTAGMVVSAELVQSSADTAMDAEILRELRQGELRLPVPPAQGRGIRDPIRSVWAFEIVISVSPPVPTLTGSFDLVQGRLDLRLPLDRRIYKYVELVSVD